MMKNNEALRVAGWMLVLAALVVIAASVSCTTVTVQTGNGNIEKDTGVVFKPKAPVDIDKSRATQERSGEAPKHTQPREHSDPGSHRKDDPLGGT